MKHGFMVAAKLEACQVPKDPTFPASVEGYVVSFMAFYERGFDAPPHQFLHSLLRCYGLKLHHLTPLRVLHIVAFVTFCQAYMGIYPNLNLWKYFFCIRRPQDLEVELTISRGAVIPVLGHNQLAMLRLLPCPYFLSLLPAHRHQGVSLMT
jgi:hypothetical protein